MTDRASDLTGTWHGTFNYPHMKPPNNFTAILRDQAGLLSGETIEIADNQGEPKTEIQAFISGTHAGGAVAFEKRYDDLGRADYVVSYTGEIHDEGHEIRGRWSIPKIWSGTFIMIRRREAEALIEAEVTETVR
jgi:hypothetical protein